MKNEIVDILIKKRELSKEDFKAYLKNRIQMLDKTSAKTIIGPDTSCYIYNDYIGTNTSIQCSVNLLDEVDLLFSYMQYDGDNRILELIYNNITNSEYNEITLLLPFFQMTLLDSLGLSNSNGEREKILDENAKKGKRTTYSEIRNKLLCMCIEKAVLFHNIYKILGFDSQVFFGSIEKEGIPSIHAYNIIRLSPNEKRRLLVDFTDISFIDENGNKDVGVPAAFISDEEYEMLVRGEKITVDMSKFMELYEKKLKPRYDTYGAGISKSDKERILEYNLIHNGQTIDDHLSNKETPSNEEPNL